MTPDDAPPPPSFDRIWTSLSPTNRLCLLGELPVCPSLKSQQGKKPNGIRQAEAGYPPAAEEGKGTTGNLLWPCNPFCGRFWVKLPLHSGYQCTSDVKRWVKSSVLSRRPPSLHCYSTSLRGFPPPKLMRNTQVGWKWFQKVNFSPDLVSKSVGTEYCDQMWILQDICLGKRNTPFLQIANDMIGYLTRLWSPLHQIIHWSVTCFTRSLKTNTLEK